MVIFVLPTSLARQIAFRNEAEIQLLAVYLNSRGQGIATQLINTCEMRAIQSGFDKIVLSTQQTMKQAHHVYEKLGYKRNPSRDWSLNMGKTYLVYEKTSLQII